MSAARPTTAPSRRNARGESYARPRSAASVRNLSGAGSPDGTPLSGLAATTSRMVRRVADPEGSPLGRPVDRDRLSGGNVRLRPATAGGERRVSPSLGQRSPTGRSAGRSSPPARVNYQRPATADPTKRERAQALRASGPGGRVGTDALTLAFERQFALLRGPGARGEKLPVSRLSRSLSDLNGWHTCDVAMLVTSLAPAPPERAQAGAGKHGELEISREEYVRALKRVAGPMAPQRAKKMTLDVAHTILGWGLEEGAQGGRAEEVWTRYKELKRDNDRVLEQEEKGEASSHGAVERARVLSERLDEARDVILRALGKAPPEPAALGAGEGLAGQNMGIHVSHLQRLVLLSKFNGYEEVRAQRGEWKERLQALPSAVSPKERDWKADEGVLRGAVGRGTAARAAVLARARRGVRFLLSSTFTDTREERNFLISDVLPYLQEYARRLDLECNIVEMRWGIRSKASADHETSESCMEELERCMRDSLGLAYLFIATQKYGFRPFPNKIPQSYFESLLDRVDKAEERKELKEWFKLDENCREVKTLPSQASSKGEVPEPEEWQPTREFAGPEGPCYVLKSSLGEANWWEKFGRMHESLRKAAESVWPEQSKALQDPEKRHFAQRFVMSVTEEEFTRGLLRLGEDSRKKKRALVIRRRLKGLRDAPVKDFIDCIADQKKVDSEAQKHLERQIVMSPKELVAMDEELEWMPDSPGVDLGNLEHVMYLKKFADCVCREVTDSLLAGAQEIAVKPDPEVDEASRHLKVALERADRFQETESTKDVSSALFRYMQRDGAEGKGDEACVVWGSSGCGKSDMMAKTVSDVITAAESSKGGGCVVVRFVGATPASSSLHGVLTSLCNQLVRAYKKTKKKEIPHDLEALKGLFREAVTEWPNAEKPLKLFLDGVDLVDDMMDQENHGDSKGEGLLWLPMTDIGKHTRLVVSSFPRGHARKTSRNVGDGNGNRATLEKMEKEMAGKGNVLEIKTLSEPEIVLEHLLALKGRKLSRQQMAAVTEVIKTKRVGEDAGSPLWLTVVAGVASTWHSFDDLKEGQSLLRAPSATTATKLNFKLTTVAMPKPTVEGVMLDWLLALEQRHGEVLLHATLGYIMLCQDSGLTEAELLHILSLNDDCLASVYEWWVPPTRRLPFLVLSRMLGDLWLSRRETSAKDQLVTWYHRPFWEAAEAYLFWVAAPDQRKDENVDEEMPTDGQAQGDREKEQDKEKGEKRRVGDKRVEDTADKQRERKSSDDKGLDEATPSTTKQNAWSGVKTQLQTQVNASQATREQRHQELVEYFDGRWAGRPKPYNARLAKSVQRPSFFPGETEGDRGVPAQPLMMFGELAEAVGRKVNSRRVMELVRHMIGTAGRHENTITRQLTSIEYVAAKFAIGQSKNLLHEYTDAMDSIMANSQDGDGLPAGAHKRLDSCRAYVQKNEEAFIAADSPALIFERAEEEASPFQLSAKAYREGLKIAKDGRPKESDKHDASESGIDRSVLRVDFERIDTNGDGLIDAGEFVRGFAGDSHGNNASELFEEMNGADGNGQIDFDEFAKGFERTMSKPMVLSGSLHEASEDRKLNIWRLSELVSHFASADEEDLAVQELCSIEYVAAKFAIGSGVSLLQEYIDVAQQFPESSAKLRSWKGFVGRNMEALQNMSICPLMPFQLALQEPDDSDEYQSALKYSQQHFGEGGKLLDGKFFGWVDPVEKPQTKDARMSGIKGSDTVITCVSVSPDGHLLATGCTDNNIHIYTISTGQKVDVFKVYKDKGSVKLVAWNPDGSRIASTSSNGMFLVCSASGQVDDTEFGGHTQDNPICRCRHYRAEFTWDWAVLRNPNCNVKSAYTTQVSCMAWSPDGLLLATGCTDDQVVTIWDSMTKERRALLTRGIGMVGCVAWSPDGLILATAGHDHTGVKIWDVAKRKTIMDNSQGEPFRILSGHKHAVSFIRWSSDKKNVLTAGGGNTVYLWGASEDETRAIEREQVYKVGQGGGYLSDAAWSPDDQGFAVAAYDGRAVHIFMKVPQSDVTMCPDWWCKESKSPANYQLARFQHDPESIAWAPESELLAVLVYSPCDLEIWDTKKRERVYCFKLGRGAGCGYCVDWSPPTLVAVTQGKKVRGSLIAVSLGKDTIELFVDEYIAEDDKLRGHTRKNESCTCTFNPEYAKGTEKSKPPVIERYVRTADPKCPVKTEYHLIEKMQEGLKGHRGQTRCVEFSPDGKLLASGGDDGCLRVWGLEAESEDTKVWREKHASGLSRISSVRSLAWSPDSSRLITLGVGQGLTLWNAERLEQVASYTDCSLSFVQYGGYYCTWDPTGNFVLFANKEEVWCMDPKEIRSPPDAHHTGGIHCLGWNKDGTVLASGSSDRTVCLWSADGEFKAQLKGHSGAITSLSWAPDGSTLATASRDRTLRLWRTSIGTSEGEFRGHSQDVSAVAWAPDKSFFVSASSDGSVYVWDPACKSNGQAQLENNAKDSRLRKLEAAIRADMSDDEAGRTCKVKGEYTVVAKRDIVFIKLGVQDAEQGPYEACFRCPTNVKRVMTSDSGDILAVRCSNDKVITLAPELKALRPRLDSVVAE